MAMSKDHGQLKDEMVDSNEGYQLCCLCEQKKGKLFGYKNECAKKGDGPASQCGDKCDNKVRDGWMCGWASTCLISFPLL